MWTFSERFPAQLPMLLSKNTPKWSQFAWKNAVSSHKKRCMASNGYFIKLTFMQNNVFSVSFFPHLIIRNTQNKMKYSWYWMWMWISGSVAPLQNVNPGVSAGFHSHITQEKMSVMLHSCLWQWLDTKALKLNNSHQQLKVRMRILLKLGGVRSCKENKVTMI